MTVAVVREASGPGDGTAAGGGEVDGGGGEGQVLAEMRLQQDRGQASAMPRLVADCLERAQAQEAALSGHQFDKPLVRRLAQVIVMVGPGSFTGIRVGLSLAKGLVAGLPGAQLVGITQQDYWASWASDQGLEGDQVLVCVDTKRRDYFCCAADDRGEWSVRAELAASDVLPQPAWLVGDGAQDIPCAFPVSRNVEGVSPALFVQTARHMARRGQPTRTQPLYVREAAIHRNPKSQQAV